MADLFDSSIRRQLYIEGVKQDFEEKFNSFQNEFYTELVLLFALLPVSKMDELTKKELDLLVSEIKEIEKRLFNSFYKEVEKDLSLFSNIDYDINKDMLESYSGLTLTEAYEENKSELFSLAVLLSSEKLFSKIENLPMPATGETWLKYLLRNFNTNFSNINNTVRLGYANRHSKEETLNLITGTKNKGWKNGYFNTMRNGYNSTISTIIQHISANINGGLSSAFYRRYIWVSILDGRTTVICRSRDGKIYVYGSGPLPPAHINCRSVIVPYNKDVVDLSNQTYYFWIKAQDAKIQNDLLGKSNAEELRKGNLSFGDFQKVNIRKIKLTDYRGKKKLILS